MSQPTRVETPQPQMIADARGLELKKQKSEVGDRRSEIRNQIRQRTDSPWRK